MDFEVKWYTQACLQVFSLVIAITVDPNSDLNSKFFIANDNFTILLVGDGFLSLLLPLLKRSPQNF